VVLHISANDFEASEARQLLSRWALWLRSSRKSVRGSAPGNWVEALGRRPERMMSAVGLMSQMALVSCWYLLSTVFTGKPRENHWHWCEGPRCCSSEKTFPFLFFFLC
jgi:hypothetical protein